MTTSFVDHHSQFALDPQKVDEAQLTSLLAASPSTYLDPVLSIYAIKIDQLVEGHVKGSKPNSRDVEALTEALMATMTSAKSSWAPILSNWSVALLGELSAKYSNRVVKSGTVSDTLTSWLLCPGVSHVVRVTETAFSALIDADDGVENAVSLLLDLSVRHAPHFDWLVAFLGAKFPNTIVNRVINVGLKDFCQSAENQVNKKVIIAFTLTFYQSNF